MPPLKEPFKKIANPAGLGDTVANLAHATGLDRVAKRYERITGRCCGCDRRQADWNRRYPYGTRKKN
jgi:hypothetical protein